MSGIAGGSGISAGKRLSKLAGAGFANVVSDFVPSVYDGQPDQVGANDVFLYLRCPKYPLYAYCAIQSLGERYCGMHCCVQWLSGHH